jgi:hypothetical protein
MGWKNQQETGNSLVKSKVNTNLPAKKVNTNQVNEQYFVKKIKLLVFSRFLQTV